MIERAIERHGARQVYEAACAFIDGKGVTALLAVGLNAGTLGDAFLIQTRAYQRMSRADQVADYWGASHELSRRA